MKLTSNSLLFMIKQNNFDPIYSNSTYLHPEYKQTLNDEISIAKTFKIS